MEKNDRNLLTIIKAALLELPGELEGELDLEGLLLLSRRHMLVTLVMDGLYRLTGEQPEDERFLDLAYFLLRRDQNQLLCLEALEACFQAHGIEYMLLKGASVKKIYPRSEWRLMGDLDILIKESQYDKIRALLEELGGLTEEKESDHELIWSSSSGVTVELHKRLIPSYNDDYYAYYADPWQRAKKEQNGSYTMAPEDEYLYIFTHLTKHYRDGGIGLRHMLDVYYFARKHPELDWVYICEELRKLGLETFHENIVQTNAVWFEGKEGTELTEHITRRVMESGSFGSQEKKNQANAARISAREDSAASARRKTFRSMIFLPYTIMKQRYPVLRKVPILLPLFWVVRWVDGIFNKRKSISRQWEQINKMNDQEIDRYNRELELVGLRFDLRREQQ